LIANERRFADRQGLAEQLSSDVAQKLRGRVESGNATLAVSGGETPKLFFEKLSAIILPWECVTVTLVDERQVPETSPRSNAKLVRDHLLRDRARSARFIPLFQNPDIAPLPRFDVVILGMGRDGHTASFFPHAANLASALSPNSSERIIATTVPDTGEARSTFTLPVLLDTDYLVLHIEGKDKRKILDRALADGPVEAMPVRAILRSITPLHLYWCP
jgi:6-phosphogluconolactonase